MPTWFITGIDELVIAEKVYSICKGIEVTSFYANEVDLSSLTSRLSSANLFSLEEAYWIKEVNRLSFNKRTEKSLRELISSAPTSTILIFSQELYFDGEYVESKKFEEGTLAKLLKELADHFVDIPYSPFAVNRWAEQRALNRYALLLSKNQVEKIVSMSRELPSLIDSELRKLALLKTRAELERVPDEWFERIVTKTIGNELNEIREMILEKNMSAIYLLFEVYKREPIGPALLSELHRSLETIYKLKTEEGMGAVKGKSETRKMAHLRSMAKRWTLEDVIKAMRIITETLFKQRTGRVAGKSPDEAQRNSLAILIKQIANL